MMIHTTSESENTSSTAASPPPAPAYFVQSPSSHDDDNKSSSSGATATKTTSTPTGYRSPSSDSSAVSRVSGRFRRKGKHVRGKLLGHVSEGEEGEEEREVYVNWWKDEEREEVSRSCKVVMVMVGLFLVFMVACFFVWLATGSFIPQVDVQKMNMDNLYIGEGLDETGVPSKMLTINCTLRMRVHNPATFFGIHVSFSPINLRYYHLTLASAQMEAYYQPKRSWRTVSTEIKGRKVPLYGAGDGFVLSKNDPIGVPMILDFEITTLGNVLGNLVRTKHTRHIQCPFSIISHAPQIVHFAQNSCV